MAKALLRSEVKDEEDDFFKMANLFPKHTGLPFVVWVSIRGNTRHDVRVKVSPGPKVQPGEMASVGLRPSISVIEGTVSAHDLKLLTTWIELNREAILQYWAEEIDTVDLVLNIRAIGV